MEDKVCKKCGVTHQGERDGTTTCPDCLRTLHQERVVAREEQTLAGIEEQARRLFTRGASRGGENVPHVSEVLERVMTLFGGSGGFASMLVKQYYDAPPGSATRTKMLEAITKLTVQTSEMGASKKPLELWTDDELEEELDKRLETIAASYQVVDAQPRLNGPVIGVPVDDDIPAEAVEGSASRDLPEVVRSDQDVPGDTDTGGDAQVQGE